jgi:hypothetical protein
MKRRQKSADSLPLPPSICLRPPPPLAHHLDHEHDPNGNRNTQNGPDGNNNNNNNETPGLLITGLPAQPPVNTTEAFAFRLHLDGSRLGFVLFDGPHPGAAPGSVVTLSWASGAPTTATPTAAAAAAAAAGRDHDAAGLVALDYRTPAAAATARQRGGSGGGHGSGGSGWVPIVAAVPNSGAYEWTVPRSLAPGTVVEVRVRATDDARISDVMEVAIRAD